MDSGYLDTLAAALTSRPEVVRLDPGLTDAEIESVQSRFGFLFPPDLRSVLQRFLPVGEYFLDWRNGAVEDLLARLVWPLEGILLDVAQGWWRIEWGDKPSDSKEAKELVWQIVKGAPLLVPIFSHRYIPSEPLKAGNPVFSVHQTDIIHYGNDLASYFHHEFGVALPDWAARDPRPIRFWDRAMRWREDEENYGRK